ncbi:hypothetical protein ACQVWE_13390 [Bacillus cereus]|uniref:hypothetical protein n=1 Tax=Bacillus cereus TaxID=1396 RepID=UPI003D65FB2B
MTKYPYVVKFVDNSGKEHVHDYEYQSTANLFYEQMKEFYPNSKPMLIDKKESQ